jgi:hypothetical protein
MYKISYTYKRERITKQPRAHRKEIMETKLKVKFKHLQET